jgi:uridine phosphorylase
MSLRSSELVLNANGSIYHLGLRPEHLAPTIFLVGDPGRVPRVAAHFDALEFQAEKREFRSCTGRIGERRYTVLSTGIGTDNIDIALNEADALVNIDLEARRPKADLQRLRFIRLGTSGSLQGSIGVGSVVLSSHGLGLDGLLAYYRDAAQVVQTGEATEGEALPWPEALRDFPLPPYLARADAGLLALFPESWPRGITATCPGFYAPQGRTLRLQPLLADLPQRLSALHFGPHRVLNFEMETAAIYGLGAMLGHACLSVNAILANRITGEFAPDPASAVDRMIEQVLGVLEAEPDAQ